MMAAHTPWRRRNEAPPAWRCCELLQDRRSECELLDGLLDAVRAGESRVLVVCGEAGVGKSALPEYLVAGRRGVGQRIQRGLAALNHQRDPALGGAPREDLPVQRRADSLPARRRN